MPIKIINLKCKAFSILLVVFVLCFVWIFLGSTNPFRIVPHESIAQMQEKINTDCYYFDIESARANHISSKIERRYYTNKSCVSKWDDPNDLPVATEVGYSIEYQYEDIVFHCYADFENPSLIEDESFALDKSLIEINDTIFTFYIVEIYSGYRISLMFSIDDIGYVFIIDKCYLADATEVQKQETLDFIKSEVEGGLFERIYNTGYKKDGTKLVDE